MARGEWLLVGVLFCAGCGPAQPQGGPPPGPMEEPDPSAQPAAPRPAPWTKIEKPAGIELVPLEFKLGNTELVIDAPPGTKAENQLISMRISDGKKFALVVTVADKATTPEYVRQMGERAADAHWLLNEPNIAVLLHSVGDKAAHAAVVAKDVGKQYVYAVSPAAYDAPEPTEAELRLIVYAATTLRRKQPLPTDAKALVKELASIAFESDGEFENVHLQAITPEGLASMLPAFGRLERLKLMGSVFDDESVRQIAALPNLQYLILEETSVTDAGVAAAAALPKLREFELADSVFSKNAITGVTLAAFAGKPLERLEILVPLSAEGWAAVAKLTQLKRLKAPSNKCPSDEQLDDLAGLTQLDELVLNHGDLTDACMETLGKFKGLKILWLSSNDEITDAGLAKLASLTELETLAVDGTQISDASLPLLKSFPKLKTFHGDGSKMSEAALLEFKSELEKRK